MLLQKLESLAILIALLSAYYLFGFSWIWFALLLLVPDVSMIGYLKDPKLGATIYNIGHSYTIPTLLFILVWLPYSHVLENMRITTDTILMIAIIWASHIAMDRALGFGLKLPTGFKDTHLGTLR